jgi:hypothetical protein
MLLLLLRWWWWWWWALLQVLGSMPPWRWRGRRRLVVRLSALPRQFLLHALQAQEGGQQSLQACNL